jgi:DNA repair protein RadC
VSIDEPRGRWRVLLDSWAPEFAGPSAWAQPAQIEDRLTLGPGTRCCSSGSPESREPAHGSRRARRARRPAGRRAAGVARAARTRRAPADLSAGPIRDARPIRNETRGPSIAASPEGCATGTHLAPAHPRRSGRASGREGRRDSGMSSNGGASARAAHVAGRGRVDRRGAAGDAARQRDAGRLGARRRPRPHHHLRRPPGAGAAAAVDLARLRGVGKAKACALAAALELAAGRRRRGRCAPRCASRAMSSPSTGRGWGTSTTRSSTSCAWTPSTGSCATHGWSRAGSPPARCCRARSTRPRCARGPPRWSSCTTTQRRPDSVTDDLALTARLKQAGSVLGIKPLDHVIIGEGQYVSLVDEGHFASL